MKLVYNKKNIKKHIDKSKFFNFINLYKLNPKYFIPISVILF